VGAAVTAPADDLFCRHLLMGGPWGELPVVNEPWPVDMCPDCGRADCMGGGCPPSTTARSADDYDEWADDPAEWARRRPDEPSGAAGQHQVCECPSVRGVIRHDRDICTDPVVVRLDWFPS
jgi:hypothetical protein